MIETVSINPPGKLHSYTEVKISGSTLDGFPFLSIDRDSYIVQAEIQSGINFRPEKGRHCIAIGKGCSLADDITFIIDINHDYKSVAQGAPAFLNDVTPIEKIQRKGTIIIQNDVWVGHGATIMAGVTLHNGCVVAAKAVVTKDVPPYAIVGGNPAKVLRYRFDEYVVESLQKIAWWDWPESVLRSRRKDFTFPAEVFVSKYLPTATEQLITPMSHESEKKVIFFPADVDCTFPLYPKILAAYFEKDRPSAELIIYLPEDLSSVDYISAIERILAQYEERNSFVTLQTGITMDERMLFQMADYYITTRDEKTVWRTCLADQYSVKILYGTDDPLFPLEL